MATTIPFFLQLTVVLAASSGGTLSTQVSNGESLKLSVLEIVSTSTLGVTDIRLSNGRRFTNASTANYIPNTVLQNGSSANIGILMLPEPIYVDGGETFYIDLLDTSAAQNTVRVTLVGSKDTV